MRKSDIVKYHFGKKGKAPTAIRALTYERLSNKKKAV